MWYFFLFDPVFFLFPPLLSLVPGYVIKDAVEVNYENDHDSWLLNIRYLYEQWIITVKNTKFFMKVLIVICVHAWETITHARVNLYEMST